MHVVSMELRDQLTGHTQSRRMAVLNASNRNEAESKARAAASDRGFSVIEVVSVYRYTGECYFIT